MTSPLLEQGISAALSGRRDEARTLLAQVVEADERNEQAWLWLAGLVEDPEDMRTCLENVLHLNPNNVKAQQGLAWVEQQHGKRPASEAVAEIDAPPAPAGYVAPAPQPAAPQAPAARPDPAPILALAALPQPENPCPYCGAATAPDDKRCPSCRQSLMVRVDPKANRSKALTALGWLWGIGGVFSLLSAALMIFVLISLRRSGGFYGIRLADLNNAGVTSIRLLGQMLGSLAAGLIQLTIARGLLGRKRWAWIVTAVLQALQLLGGLCGVVFFAVGIRMALANLPGSAGGSGSPLVTMLFVALLLAVFAPQIVSLLLLFFSYGDVFAPTKRLDVKVAVVSPTQHYNKGLDYKNRGMWHMAAQEWAAAVRHAPHQPDFLHALGLAFVQLKQYDKARATLDFALRLAPGDAQIADSRALVDREEKRGWW